MPELWTQHYSSFPGPGVSKGQVYTSSCKSKDAWKKERNPLGFAQLNSLGSQVPAGSVGAGHTMYKPAGCLWLWAPWSLSTRAATCPVPLNTSARAGMCSVPLSKGRDVPCPPSPRAAMCLVPVQGQGCAWSLPKGSDSPSPSLQGQGCARDAMAITLRAAVGRGDPSQATHKA